MGPGWCGTGIGGVGYNEGCALRGVRAPADAIRRRVAGMGEPIFEVLEPRVLLSVTPYVCGDA
ncbi:MAG: LEPR-XLL domain-containing protein, partial [Planctomycetota bacterium]